MTNAELNARAAEIMGYTVNGITGDIMDVRGKWNPCENIAQAFEVAEKFPVYQITMNLGTYYVRVYYEPVIDMESVLVNNGKSLPEAITRACVAAAEKAK